MAELKRICSALDKLTLEYFDNLEQLQLCQKEINALLKDGYYLLGKSRYNMGVQAVTSLQYNLEDLQEAIVKVHMCSDDNPSETTEEEIEQSDNIRSGLRNRRNLGEADAADILKDISLNDSFSMTNTSFENSSPPKQDKVTSSKYKDPIKWFGVLVPQTLRLSQNKFQDAAQRSCYLASLKLKHLQLIDLFTELKKKKSALLSQCDSEK